VSFSYSYAEFQLRWVSVVLEVVMLSVVMLSVVLLGVVAPRIIAFQKLCKFEKNKKGTLLIRVSKIVNLQQKSVKKLVKTQPIDNELKKYYNFILLKSLNHMLQ
jgi:hypothetical protein